MMVTSRLRIRPATIEDHPALVKLCKTSKYTKDFSNQQMFSSEDAYQKGWIRLIYAEDTKEPPLGFTCVRHKSRSPETMLYFIVVEPDVQGLGIGRLLMQDLEKQTPHPRIALKVEKDNKEAIVVYSRLGYCVESLNEYNGKGQLMAKAIVK